MDLKTKIETAFYEYTKLKETHNKIISDVANRLVGAINYDSPRVKTSRSNTVEKQVIKAVSEREERTRWCILVETVCIMYELEDKYKFIVEYYFHRKPLSVVIKDLYICEATAMRWKADILDTAQRVAERLNLE